MTTPLLTRIDTVFLPVRSLADAIEWYGAHLGWPLVWRNEEIAIFQHEGGTPLTLLQHRYPGVRDVPADEPFEPRTEVRFNFLCQDIEAAHRDFQARGVEAGELMDHGDAQEFHFRDPDGNLLSVVRC